jgi:folate-dependent tRNA-U54 methylase TrmFO/GidA
MRTNNFDWSKNYWECFPEITTIVSFKEFKDKDKSKNKEESSRIMWAIHLCLKPNSLLYNDPEKWNRVKVSILEDSKFKWDKYENLKTDYMELVLAPAEKYFHIFNDILEKKRVFLKDFDYTKANDSQMRVVESMSTNMYKIGLEYDKVKKLLNEEYSNTEKPKSLMDE